MKLSNNTRFEIKRNGKSVGIYKGAIKLFALIEYVQSIGFDGMESFRKEFPNDEFKALKK